MPGGAGDKRFGAGVSPDRPATVSVVLLPAHGTGGDSHTAKNTSEIEAVRQSLTGGCDPLLRVTRPVLNLSFELRKNTRDPSPHKAGEGLPQDGKLVESIAPRAPGFNREEPCPLVDQSSHFQFLQTGRPSRI